MEGKAPTPSGKDSVDYDVSVVGSPEVFGGEQSSPGETRSESNERAIEKKDQSPKSQDVIILERGEVPHEVDIHDQLKVYKMNGTTTVYRCGNGYLSMAFSCRLWLVVVSCFWLCIMFNSAYWVAFLLDCQRIFLTGTVWFRYRWAGPFSPISLQKHTFYYSKSPFSRSIRFLGHFSF